MSDDNRYIGGVHHGSNCGCNINQETSAMNKHCCKNNQQEPTEFTDCCKCNLCDNIQEGDLITVGTLGGTVLIGNVVSNDNCTLILTATTITILGIVLTVPTGILSTPILICCDKITFIAKTGLIIGG